MAKKFRPPRRITGRMKRFVRAANMDQESASSYFREARRAESILSGTVTRYSVLSYYDQYCKDRWDVYAGARTRMAHLLQKFGYVDKALHVFDQQTSLVPDDVKAWQSKGDIYRSMARFEDSQACYLKILALKPRDLYAKISLANLHIKFGQYDRAREWLQESIDGGDRSRSCWNTQLKLEYTQRRFGAMLDLLEARLSEQPRDFIALAYMMKVHMAYEDRDRAMTYCNALSGVDLDRDWRRYGSDLFIYLRNEALVFAEVGQIDRARGNFDLLRRMEDRHEGTMLTEARFERDYGDKDRARDLYDQMIAAYPYATLARCESARMAYDAGDRGRAFALVKASLAIDPNDNHALAARGEFLTKEGCYEEAERCFERALDRDPRHRGILTLKAVFLFRVMRFDEAKEVLNTVLEGSPYDAVAHVWLAKLHMQTRDYEDALPHLQGVLERNARNSHARNVLGQYYIDMDEAENARECFEAVLRLDPDNMAAQSGLRRVEWLIRADPSYSQRLCGYDDAYDDADDVMRCGFALAAGGAGDEGRDARDVRDVPSHTASEGWLGAEDWQGFSAAPSRDL